MLVNKNNVECQSLLLLRRNIDRWEQINFTFFCIHCILPVLQNKYQKSKQTSKLIIMTVETLAQGSNF